MAEGPEIKVLMNTYCGVFMCHVGIHQNFDKLRQGISKEMSKSAKLTRST